MNKPEPVIPETLVRSQAWKYYLALMCWPLYLFVLPWVWTQNMTAGFLFLVFPGVYLFTELGYLIHECWHHYVPNVPNKQLYNLYSWMLLTDPQVYYLLHGSHHLNVNTWADEEFHPFGEIKSRPLLVLINISEIVFGIASLVIFQAFAMSQSAHFSKKYSIPKMLISLCVWVLFLISIGWATSAVLGVPVSSIVASYVMIFWLGGLALHHSQLVEHGNLVVTGDWNERNLKTRNLQASGVAEQIFLFLTHGDSREHVLHHVLPAVHSRPFPGKVMLPPGAVMITFRDYGRILREMIAGRTDPAPGTQGTRSA